MDLLITLLIGFFAGWLASVLYKGTSYGLVGNIILGLVGSFIGSLLASAMGIRSSGTLGAILIATLGAVVLLALGNLLRGESVRPTS